MPFDNAMNRDMIRLWVGQVTPKNIERAGLRTCPFAFQMRAALGAAGTHNPGLPRSTRGPATDLPTYRPPVTPAGVGGADADPPPRAALPGLYPGYFTNGHFPPQDYEAPSRRPRSGECRCVHSTKPIKLESIMEVEAYRNLFNTDLSTLTDGVLQAVAAAVRQECDRRRRDKLQGNRVFSAWEDDAAKRFQGLTKPHHEFNVHWLRYLDELLKQDWSHLFSDGDSECKYYVYMHYEPSGKDIRFVSPNCSIKINGRPFYVGKGAGNRAYDMNRNQGHGEILRQLLKGGSAPQEIVHICKDGLSEARALELESKLIYFFGTRYQKGRRGLLVNLDIPPRPEMAEGGQKYRSQAKH